VPEALVAPRATVVVEVAVGVPEIKPELLSVSGDGSGEAVNDVGVFVAVI